MSQLVFLPLFPAPKNRSGKIRTTSRMALLAFLAVAILGGCKKTATDKELAYPLETAKLVSQVTSGIVSPSGAITVRFTSPVIQEKLVGQSISKAVFSFDPSITGVTRWQDRHTLVFQPNTALPLREKYEGVLDLGALFPLHKEKLEPLKFRFEVAGREIASIRKDFKLLKEDDPRNFSVIGTLSLTEAAELSAVEKAVALRKNGGKLRLRWSADGDGKTFQFTSEAILRGREEINFVLKVDKDPLEISRDYEESFSFPALSDLKISSVSTREEGDAPGIAIEFSDELDTRQDLTGLISVADHPEVKLKTLGKQVFLSGNFQYGQQYTLKVSRGVRSRWGTTLTEPLEQVVEFSELKPQMKFASDGVFLPSANQRALRFLTVNVRKVRVVVKKVFENNLAYFMQSEQLSSSKTRNNEFGDYNLERVGVAVYDDTLELGEERNIWKQHELDLSKLIGASDRGLYVIEMTFRRKDMLYGDISASDEEEERYYYGDDYYSNPYSYGYLYARGRIYKAVIVSDIGLTYKRAHQRHIVYATHLADARPLSGVKITLKTYQNQEIASATTDSDGYADFRNIEAQVFLVEGEKDGQRSVIKTNEMGWNLSTFDTGGEEDTPGGARAFIYTERGVYRPGDEVNICVIARNQQNTFPDNHPITLRIFNPRNQKVYERVNKEGREGFYNFNFQSAWGDPTGNWRVEALVGSQTFHHTLKIETVAPFRLKVKLEPEKPALTHQDKSLNLLLSSTYLFGNPAAGLNAEVDLTLKAVNKSFRKFGGYNFSNQAVEFRPIEQTIFNGVLDAEGKARISWPLPTFINAPSALSAELRARVFEKGGRPNLSALAVPIDPYPAYVGLKVTESDYGYLTVGAISKVSFIVVNPAGEPLAGRALTYRIYKGQYHWWWEYEARRDYRLRFKSHQTTQLIQEGALVSKGVPDLLEFVPEEEGTYFVEVQDGNGHAAGLFLNAYLWGSVPAEGESAEVLALKTDKEKYFIGDQAVISFPAPEKGAILLSVEKGSQVLSSRWHSPVAGQREVKITLPVTAEMLPTAYASVSIIQPHAQTLNDRPLRLYGVVPLNVEDPSTHQEIFIDMPGELRSNEKFKVNIRTADQRPTQLTVAVVDEGLLDLTAFATPDPWKYFFKKLRLGVATFDLFNYVIGANKGDVFRVFSIGGDMMETYRESQLDEKKKRFKPVSMFKGPLMTDGQGRASVEFQMPEYVGSVRVMVIAARGNRYGRAEKTVPVKTELMVLSGLPRVIGPTDQFTVPVTVFAMKENIGAVEVSLALEGPLTLQDSAKKQIFFTSSGDKEVFFTVKAEAAVGPAKVTVRAQSAQFSTKEETDLEVRPSSPRIYSAEDKTVEPGGRITFTIPDRGIPGSNQARLSIRRRPNLNFTHRLLWLIRFPYGCIEQATSAVFPQLYLKDFLRDVPISGRLLRAQTRQQAEREIDANINRSINRLRSFQLPSGGFAYWPGNSEVNEWGTNYAGHFLIEAKKLGYNVPEDLYENWLKFQERQAMSARELPRAPKRGATDLNAQWTRLLRQYLLTQSYRLYLLALAGKPSLGAMNYLKENHLNNMNDPEKWLLASAYYLAGVKNTAEQIAKSAGKSVETYSEFGGTYGSGLRDRAIILEMLTETGRWAEADQIADELSAVLSKQEWHSTQTTGYMLMAVGKYLRALEGKSGSKPRLKGVITLPDGQKNPFDTEEVGFEIELLNGFGQQVTVELDKGYTGQRAFATLSWNGVPLLSDVRDEAKNLTLKVEWLDDDGMVMDPTEITQGKTFWGHFTVGNPNSAYHLIEEVALVQVLPAGWEIENIRLSGEAHPDWMSRWSLNREEYLDLRDDRVMWFFDARYGGRYDFVVKLNAVTVGEFTMPPTLVEAMYNNDFQATKAWPKVRVKAR